MESNNVFTTNPKKKSKHLATISLAIMGVGFVATMPFGDSIWGRLLQGGFEAGLVGGLADWFAVTALFRHPLGIPIPHTALLPKNRKRITRGLVSTLENDWLSKESIQEKVKRIAFTKRLLPIVRKGVHSETIQQKGTALLVDAINRVDTEKVVPIIEKELKSSLSAIELKPIVHSIVGEVVRNQYDEKALDVLLNKGEGWIKKEETQYQLGSIAKNALDNIELDGILQFALKSFQSMINEEKLGSILQNLLLSITSRLRNEDDEYRLALVNGIRKELQGLEHNEELLEKLEAWKQKTINELNVTNKLTEIVDKMKAKVTAFIESPEFMKSYAVPYVESWLNALEVDAQRQEAIDTAIQKQIMSFVDENHSKIGQLVQENLDKLDDETLVDMMENNVGKDLQWIRVNGALCGFLIGIVLTVIKLAV
ncbi:DUF445 domain-containing protein [Priestia aryabhattai]|uniref:DUF445 domain-containing protein n=1 Tax=Priestia aryabhattai TaxID=412384 RepID=UPI00203A53A9|nr:DUF445 domain-containing protein [Priestia aryabhattai]MCL9637990.1 DUF445 domain-containing protein [Bacillus zanthoxyli]MCM2978379.1 DUF445 domain-containing protein [Priestia aryabhattai]MED3888102.1 DUF445 domain-containing protein [Priestia aryabhattai]MED4006152.1 DUF445 domain-containing protein [Priestia aryabhattai]MED4256840.1 DUF445 domain-containing protein [Priestia aryabhattai]